MRSEVFADGDRLLGCRLVKGDSFGSVVALQLCFVMFFGGWAGRFGDLALGREAVYVPLPGNEVSFYVACSLLVVVDCDGALRTWDLHAQVESMNGCLELVDGAPTHYGVVRLHHVDDVESHLLTSGIGCYTEGERQLYFADGNVPLPPKPYSGLSEGFSRLWLMPMRSKAWRKMMSAWLPLSTRTLCRSQPATL
jgi:hypothetical protein